MGNGRCWARRWRVEGALHGADAKAGFGGDLRGNALRTMAAPVVALAFNRDSLTRLNIGARLQQLRIPPNMPVSLLLGQVEAVDKDGRIAKAKAAHDEVVTARYRAQADSLEIESLAKRRLADEYDADQERGEVATGRPKSIPGENTFVPTASDIGLTAKEVHEARAVRDAEAADPGVTRRALDHLPAI